MHAVGNHLPRPGPRECSRRRLRRPQTGEKLPPIDLPVTELRTHEYLGICSWRNFELSGNSPPFTAHRVLILSCSAFASLVATRLALLPVGGVEESLKSGGRAQIHSRPPPSRACMCIPIVKCCRPCHVLHRWGAPIRHACASNMPGRGESAIGR